MKSAIEGGVVRGFAVNVGRAVRRRGEGAEKRRSGSALKAGVVVAVVAVASGVMASRATAATTTVNVTGSFNVSPFFARQTLNYSLPAFDSNLGTLTSVLVELSFALGGSYTTLASVTPGSTGSYRVVIVSESPTTFVGQPLELNGQYFDVGNYSTLIGQSKSYSVTLQSSGSAATDTGTLNAFTRSTPTTLTGSLNVILGFSGPITLSVGLDSTDIGDVTYTYTPASGPVVEAGAVPLPSVATGGLVLVGLAGTRRRR